MRPLSLFIAVAALFAWATPAEAASKVSVVDLVKVMREHKESARIEKAFRDARTQADDNLKADQKQLEGMKKELEKLGLTDPDRMLKEKRYQQQLANAKFNYEWARQAAVRKYATMLESLYKGVRSVIADYARTNGIDVVLVKTDPQQPMNPVDHQDVYLKTRLRVVIYADAKTDITDAILALVK